MKKIKLLGASFLALSSLFLSSYADGRGAGNGSYNYGDNYSPYGGSNVNAPYGSSGYNQSYAPSYGYSSPYGSSTTSPYGYGSSSSYPYSGNYSQSYSGSNYAPGYSGSNYLRGSSYGDTSAYSNSSYRRAPNQMYGGNNFDMNLFEGQDENEAYSDYGYTRGDIYYIYRYKFDPNTITSVNGTVEKVIRVQYPDGENYLVVILSTQEGDLLVNLGPVNYFDAQRVVIDEGDSIQVTGSKIRLNGRFVVIGMELNRDGKVLPLRDQAGQPAWRQGAMSGGMMMGGQQMGGRMGGSPNQTMIGGPSGSATTNMPGSTSGTPSQFNVPSSQYRSSTSNY